METATAGGFGAEDSEVGAIAAAAGPDEVLIFLSEFVKGI
jgi:hypothetical protein